HTHLAFASAPYSQCFLFTPPDAIAIDTLSLHDALPISVGNHLLDRLGIRSQSRNQVPRALLIMEPQRKALQMREEIPANGEDKVLCEIAHGAREVIGQYPRDDRNQ